MTTTASPRAGKPRGTTPRVLLAAAVFVLLVVVATTLVAAVVSGSPAAWGAASGGSLALVFLLLGAVTVMGAVSRAPQLSMLVALMTFLLVVVVVAAAFVALDSSGLLGRRLAPEWVATGVVAAAVAWILAQLVGSARSRVPAFDVDLPEDARTLPESREVGAR